LASMVLSQICSLTPVIYFVSALILQFGPTQEKAKDFGVNGTFPNLYQALSYKTFSSLSLDSHFVTSTT
jgi:hypothetical protein